MFDPIESPSDWDTFKDEQRFIGGAAEMMLRKRNLQNTTQLLTCVDETWFQEDDHRYLFLALFELATLAHDPNARITDTAVLDRAEELSGETGWSRAAYANCGNATSYFVLDEFIEKEIPIWWEKQKRRRVQEALAKADQLYNLPPRPSTAADARDYITAAMAAVDAVPTCTAPDKNSFLAHWREFLEPLKPSAKISSGLLGIDKILGGGFSGPGAPDPGKLIIVAARPGMGKTALALNLAMRVALTGGKVAMWSMEMQATEISTRLIAAMDFLLCEREGRLGELPITYAMIQAHAMTGTLRERYMSQEGTAAALDDNFKVVDNFDCTPGAICNSMKLFARTNPDTRLFVIDHVGLLNVGNGNRATALGEATRQIKTTANKLGIDVLLLCQVNRALEERQEKMPSLADLRDSGRIEEDADVVLGLTRPGYYSADENDTDMVIAALKNRQGYTGSFKVAFVPDRCALFQPNLAGFN